MDIQIIITSCRNSDHYFSLSLQQLSLDSLGTKNVSSTYAQNFWKVNKLWRQKRCGGNHMVNILLKWYKLTRWVGCRKNHWATITACMKLPYCNGESGHSQRTISFPQNYFHTNCRSVIPVLLKSFIYSSWLEAWHFLCQLSS